MSIWNSCHTSVNIWYSVIIHEGSNDSLHSACAVRGSFAKFRMAERAKRCNWRVFQYLTLRMKCRWERTIEIRQVDKEKGRKGSKFTTKVFPKIQMSGMTMAMICFHLWWDLINCSFLTSKDFTWCLHFLHFNFIIVNFKLIFRSGFPSLQQRCQWFSSCLACMPISFFAELKSSFRRRLEYGC